MQAKVVLVSCALIGAAAAGGQGDPYQVATLCTAYPVNIGRRVNVSTGEELQQALDAANAGDTIMLAAGGTFRPRAGQSFVLRNRPVPSGQWVIIRSADPAFDFNGKIPPGRRVDAADGSLMPLLRATTVNIPAIRADARAHGYRLVGLDIGPDNTLHQLTNLVELGSGRDTSSDTEPSDIIVDRCYLHGSDTGDFRRGVLLNGVRLSVIDSYLANFHDSNSDSQALGGSNGAGPFRIVNNFLEAASENIMFGGSDPAIPNLVPADIEILRNLSTKRLAWRDARVPVKNAFELKSARRVLVEGNIFENVWASGQDGTAILLKSVNQGGECTGCVTEYVTFRNNIVRHAAMGVLINAAEVGRKGVERPRPANHIRLENVLFEDIGGADWGRNGGKLLRIFGGVADVSITHITSRSNRNGILDPGGPADANPRLTFKYNIVERLNYGIGVGSEEGTRTLARNFAPYVYDQNVIVNTSSGGTQAISSAALQSRYPARTWVVNDWGEVGFEPDTSRLQQSSRFYRAGDDRRDIGADIDAITGTHLRAADSCGPAAVPRKQP
jgi:hypothetical protein